MTVHQNQIFGAGKGYLRTTGATPRKIANLSEVKITEKKDLVFGSGEYTTPQIAAETGKKDEGSCKVSGLSARDVAAFVSGTRSVGSKRVLIDESATVPSPSGPYTVTVAKSASFLSDLGVRNRTTGVVFEVTTDAPTTGQYSVAAGVYTFAAADAAAPLYISYSYTDSVNGEKVIVNNLEAAKSTEFELYATNQFDGETTIHCPRIVFTGLSPIFAGSSKKMTEEYEATFTVLGTADSESYTLSTVAPT